MHPDARQTFAARVREIRLERGLSQEQVGQLIGDHGVFAVDSTAIVRLEAGKRAVRIEEAVALARVLEVDLQDLLRPATSPLEVRWKELNERRKNASKVLAFHRDEMAKARELERALIDERNYLGALMSYEDDHSMEHLLRALAYGCSSLAVDVFHPDLAAATGLSLELIQVARDGAAQDVGAGLGPAESVDDSLVACFIARIFNLVQQDQT